MRYNQDPVITNGDMSANIVSETIPLDQVFGYSVQAVYTTAGTLGGVLQLECSNDHREDNEKNVIVPGTWSIVSNSPVTVSGAGNTMWNIESVNYLWARVTYTAAMGDSGTLNATCVTKGF
jgi:hypothetical protein